MITVLGGTGNIGANVVKGLVAAGEKVRVVATDPAKAKETLGAGAEIVAGNLGDAASLEAAMKGAEKVFLLAPAAPELATWNSNGIQAAKKAGVKHVVKQSVLGADPNSPVKLAKWHAQGDEELRAAGLAWTILQPHFFMQNTLQWAPTIKSDGAFYAPLKDAKISFVDARDIADVAVAALTKKGHEGKTLVITGPEAIGFAEAATKIGAAIGKPVKYVDVPLDAFRKTLGEWGVPDWMADDFAALYGYFSTGAAAGVSPVVKETTGNKGRTYDDFLRDLGSAFK